MPTVPAAALAIAALPGVVLLVLWLRARARVRRLRGRLASSEAGAARLAVAAGDQEARLRLIQELHDVAVTRVTAMVAQADGARYAGAAEPGAAVRAARTIGETGRATLSDLRRGMTLVRQGPAVEEQQPGLESLRELFRLMRDAGLRVEFEEAGDPYALDAAAELAVYRILQEAMANALHYGGDGTTARIAFTWTASGLSVRVDDDGFRTAVLARGLPPEEEAVALAYSVADDLHALTRAFAGAGIDGMRARAELFGGTLSVTETPGVGFGVAATFPSIRFHNGVHGVDLAAR